MSEVTLKINNRGYSLACDAGQEQHLMDLSSYVDSRLRDIAAAGAASNEAHLLVLTSLVLADEVYGLRDQLAELQKRADNPPQIKQNQASISSEEEEMVARAISHLAEKIERIAARISETEKKVEAA